MLIVRVPCETPKLLSNVTSIRPGGAKKVSALTLHLTSMHSPWNTGFDSLNLTKAPLLPWKPFVSSGPGENPGPSMPLLTRSARLAPDPTGVTVAPDSSLCGYQYCPWSTWKLSLEEEDEQLEDEQLEEHEELNAESQDEELEQDELKQLEELLKEEEQLEELENEELEQLELKAESQDEELEEHELEQLELEHEDEEQLELEQDELHELDEEKLDEQDEHELLKDEEQLLENELLQLENEDSLDEQDEDENAESQELDEEDPIQITLRKKTLSMYQVPDSCAPECHANLPLTLAVMVIRLLIQFQVFGIRPV